MQLVEQEIEKRESFEQERKVGKSTASSIYFVSLQDGLSSTTSVFAEAKPAVRFRQLPPAANRINFSARERI
jgi:hypothetical protein